MASPNLIALLCAGSQMGSTGGGTNRAVLSRSELAGLLAGASEAAMDFAYAAYALDLDAERMLIARVRVAAAHLANAQKWEIVKGRPTVSNLSAIAVFEVVRPLVHKECGGVGCRLCGGTGTKPLSVRTIAAAAGLSKDDFHRNWQDRYRQILKIVCELDAEVQSVLAKANRDT
jgi:hypothetical protein